MSGCVLSTVLGLAKQTFARTLVEGSKLKAILSAEEFSKKVNELTYYVNMLKAQDLGLDRSKALHPIAGDEGISGEQKKGAAPVTYIGVYEDQDVSVGVFIVRNGCAIPLHNHPAMHGILKVLQGTLEIHQFDRYDRELKAEEVPEALRRHPDYLNRGWVLPVCKETSTTVDPSVGPVVLTPNRGNYHEIRTLGEQPAAFLDILAPPYNCQKSENSGNFVQSEEIDSYRECDFFKVLNFSPSLSHQAAGDDQKPELQWLQVTSTPPGYYCETEPFLGNLSNGNDV